MKLYYLKVSFLLLLSSFAANALEGDEEPCPAFAEGETPSCEACVESACGYAQDHGDCVKDCSTVEDTECFSLLVQSDLSVADICAMAMNMTGDGDAGAAAPDAGAPGAEGADALPVETDGAPVDAPEEVMCAAFEGSRDAPTCATCVDSGCGWTADDGDCLESCASVNDGAVCFEMAEGLTIDDVCGSSSESGGSSSSETASNSASAAAVERMATMTSAFGVMMIVILMN